MTLKALRMVRSRQAEVTVLWIHLGNPSELRDRLIQTWSFCPFFVHSQTGVSLKTFSHYRKGNSGEVSYPLPLKESGTWL
jgi:hypothetical protein